MANFLATIKDFIEKQQQKDEEVSETFMTISKTLKDTGNVEEFIEEIKSIDPPPGSDSDYSLSAIKAVLVALGTGARKSASRNKTDITKVWAGLEKSFEISTKETPPVFAKAALVQDFSSAMPEKQKAYTFNDIEKSQRDLSTNISAFYQRVVDAENEISANHEAENRDLSLLFAKRFADLPHELNVDPNTKDLSKVAKQIQTYYKLKRADLKAKLKAQYSEIVRALNSLKDIALSVLDEKSTYLNANPPSRYGGGEGEELGEGRLKSNPTVTPPELIMNIEEFSLDIQDAAKKTETFSNSLSRALVQIYADGM
jgi:hypothetical protein